VGFKREARWDSNHEARGFDSAPMGGGILIEVRGWESQRYTTGISYQVLCYGI
jgi:hypothetical protein